MEPKRQINCKEKGRRFFIMSFLVFLSQCILPLLILYIAGYGLLKKIPVYDSFVRGAMEGVKTTVKLIPTLVGLMTGVGVLSASGFLDFLSELLGKFIDGRIFPAPLLPLALVRMFSNSAATGLLLELYKEYGTDSRISWTASLMMSSCETIFYTMSIYFMTVRITKTRYTLPGALLATLGGIGASVILSNLLCG